MLTVVKVERVSDEDMNEGYSFPDEDDDLTNYEGESTQLMIPSSLLEDINGKYTNIHMLHILYYYVYMCTHVICHKLNYC